MTLDSSPLQSFAAPTTRRRLAGRVLERLLPAIACGRLQLTLPNGDYLVCNGPEAGPDASLTIHKWRGLLRMVRDGEHGFADGYLAGEWSTPDLAALLSFGMQNEGALGGRAEASFITSLRNRLAHRQNANTRRGSRRNIAAHYDLGNRFYAQWLDRSMTYSSAIYAGDETLEEAQQQKLSRIAELLDLSGGERVLEIGCGWGALADRLVRGHGAKVTGITLSTDQLSFARERLAHDIKAGRADLRLQDYRDVAGPFDRIVSIEMIEAVGEQYWSVYFQKLREVLTAGGVAVLQAITIDEARFAAYRGRPDFIQRYIFPGGMLLTKAAMAAEAARAGLALVHQECFGTSYARTLREWRGRFLRAWPTIAPLGFDQRFRRMWEYYLAYCEVGFAAGVIDVGLYKLVRQ